MLTRRLRGHGLSSPKAITATACKIAPLVYRMLTQGMDYVARGLAEHQAQCKDDKALKALTRRAREMGYQIVPRKITPAQAT